MTELHLVNPEARNGAVLDVVFVHGLGGDKLQTWRASKSADDFWPAWLAKDVPGLAVWSLGYDASPSAWLGKAMPLSDRATNALALLEADQFGQRPLIFVCHSLGGLVVKQLLRTAETMGQASWQRLASATKAVVFLATPHAGTRLANYVGVLGRILRTTVAVEDLQANDAHLRELSLWFSNNAQRLKIETKVFFETRDTAGVRVVDETSANPGISRVVPVPVDADHFSICKPADRNALVYKSIRLFLGGFSAVRAVQVGACEAPEVPTIEGRPPRYFVSYRRRAEMDARLATYLVEALRTAGCEVFIDVEMRVGVDWSAEIERRIQWADYLVVLLSEESIASEMVQAEVRRAHHASKSGQRSKILPVRVAYTGPLGYELDGYLGKLQYVLWQDEEDNQQTVVKILRAQFSTGPAGMPAVPIDATPAPARQPQPQPKADMRLLRETVDSPGSRLSHDDPFYVRRDADQRVEEFAAGKTRTVVIKGANQTGKSSLLLRYLAKSLESGKKVALVDLLTFGMVKTMTFPDFASQFAQTLMDELGICNLEPPACTRASDLTEFVEDHIFPRVEGAWVLAIDEADRVIGSPWQEDFYTALRGWDAHRARFGMKATWGRLGLALVIATDPKMLIESGYTSPFNVTVPIALGLFSRHALDALSTSYAHMLDSGQLDRLYRLMRGHPYLTQLAFYRLVQEETTFEQMVAEAHHEFGPFGDHLRARLDRLYSAGLIDAMRSIVHAGNLPNNDRRLFYRLEAAGLARDESGRIVAANELYERFFKAVL